MRAVLGGRVGGGASIDALGWSLWVYLYPGLSRDYLTRDIGGMAVFVSHCIMNASWQCPMPTSGICICSG